MIPPVPPSPPTAKLGAARRSTTALAEVTSTVPGRAEDSIFEIDGGRTPRFEVPHPNAAAGDQFGASASRVAVSRELQQTVQLAGQVRAQDALVAPDDAARLELNIRLSDQAQKYAIGPAFQSVRARGQRLLNANGTPARTDDEIVLAATREIARETWRRVADPRIVELSDVRGALWPTLAQKVREDEAGLVALLDQMLRTSFANPAWSVQLGTPELRRGIVDEIDNNRDGKVDGTSETLSAVIQDFLDQAGGRQLGFGQ